MTALFIPGISRDCGGRALDLAYRDMRRCVELEMGRRPSLRRIEISAEDASRELLDWSACSVLEFDP
jgi:hypothetical protein